MILKNLYIVYIPKTSVEALALTWCEGKHGQGLSSGRHGRDQRPSAGKVLGKDGHSGQEGQTVAQACTQKDETLQTVIQ